MLPSFAVLSLIDIILLWWEEHECDGWGGRNIYNEPPEFVKRAQELKRAHNEAVDAYLLERSE